MSLKPGRLFEFENHIGIKQSGHALNLNYNLEGWVIKPSDVVVPLIVLTLETVQ